MSQAAEFLNAVFSSTDAAISFDLNGQIITDAEEIDRDTIKERLSEAYVGPFTDQGVCFVHGFLDGATVDDVASCRLQPTAVLKKHGEDKLIFVWAFDAPVDDIRISLLTDALGMASPEEFIPLPGVDGWELLETTPECVYSFDVLAEVYVLDDTVVEADPNADSAFATEPETPATYGDAVCVTPYNETDHFNEITVALGPNRESKQWKPMSMPAGAFIARLCQHQVGRKDGPAFVLGDMVPGQRFKNRVKSLYGVGLDIDTGTPSSTVDTALAALQVQAVRYTTHSHLKTHTDFNKDRVIKWSEGREINDDLIREFLTTVEQWDADIVASAEYLGTDHTEKGIVCQVSHNPMPKHRVVLLFKEPFVIENEGKTQKEAMDKWAKVPEALARLLNVPFDTSCTDPSRLFYFPRHADGKPFEISVFGGPYFDWRTLELDDPMERLAATLDKGKSKSKTKEGKELGRWSLKRAHGFQIADVIEANAPDRIRHNTGHGLEIECPFDESHSNAGDPEDRACLVVNAGEGPSEWFTISCRHETCRDKTNLDMLGKMIADGWFEKDVLEDEQFNAILEEDQKPEVAVQIEKQDEAKKDYITAIEALEGDSSEETVQHAITLLLDAKLGTLEQVKAEKLLKKVLGVNSTDVQKLLKRARTDRMRDTKHEEMDGERMIFRYQGEFNFDDAFNICVKSLKATNDRAKKPVFSCIDSEPVRFMTKRNEGKESVSFEPISNRTLWSELCRYVAFVRTSDQGDGARGKVPEDVANLVFEQAYHKLPQAPEVIYTPLFLRDGTLLAADGYHFDPKRPDYKNLLLISNGLLDAMPQVPRAPSAEDVEEARDWIITELLSDFPFLDTDSQGSERREPSLANALAMLITPFMRRMINGRTPVFFVYKPQPGTGGTLLGQLPMWLFDGAAGSATRYSQNEEEMQKGLIAAVQEPRSHLFFDDVKDFNNRELLRAITQDNISGRLLGASRNISVPNRFNWVGTGNNTVILDEMRRRTVYIRLNAQMPDATTRIFRHPDISGMGYTEFVKKNRHIAVRHILTLIQYWISMGMPLFSERRRASFEDWSAKVGGVLQACAVEGFIDNFDVVSSDFEDAASRQFVRDLFHYKGSNFVHTPNALFDWASENRFDIISGNNEDQKRSRFMKNSLPSMQDRTYRIDGEDFMFQQAMDNQQNLGFQLVKLEREDEARAA